jgi:hypothetical protein
VGLQATWELEIHTVVYLDVGVYDPAVARIGYLSTLQEDREISFSARPVGEMALIPARATVTQTAFISASAVEGGFEMLGRCLFRCALR